MRHLFFRMVFSLGVALVILILNNTFFGYRFTYFPFIECGGMIFVFFLTGIRESYGVSRAFGVILITTILSVIISPLFLIMNQLQAILSVAGILFFFALIGQFIHKKKMKYFGVPRSKAEDLKYYEKRRKRQ